MKKILLLSDTHGHIDRSMEEYMLEADEVWHAGDIGSMEISDRISTIRPLRAVYGNIDNHEIRSCWPEHDVIHEGATRVLMLHIAGYPDRYNARARELIRHHRPQLFICGHSHILKIMRDPKNGLLHINPGAAGHHGFHQERTMVRFTIRQTGIDELEVITLGLRGHSAQSVG